jgi:arylsulfatase A-like enzyme
VEITDTKPGHATMLTGYESEITRVVSNSDFDEIPPGLTLFERLEEYFGTVGIATAMVTSKKENLGTDPGKPFHNARKVLDFWDGDVHRSADESGPIMLEVIDLFKQLPFFAFFHFADPDTAGHLYGEGSWGYLDAIRECDKWLGLIVRQLEVYGIRQRTMVYVTTDHGFNPGAHFHWRAPHIFLATDDPNIRSRGTLRDIAPTILLRYEVDVGIYSPRLLGIPLTTKEGSWR